MALRSWEHLIRSYLPVFQAPGLHTSDLSPGEQQTDADFIRPVIKLITYLVSTAADPKSSCRSDQSVLPDPAMAERCQLLAGVHPSSKYIQKKPQSLAVCQMLNASSLGNAGDHMRAPAML